MAWFSFFAGIVACLALEAAGIYAYVWLRKTGAIR